MPLESRLLRTPSWGYTRHFSGVSFESVRARIIEALRTEGFGILSEIDIRDTLKRKLAKDVPAQIILGACNPVLADRALSEDPDVALLLPCNVVIRDEGGGIISLSIARPASLFGALGDNPAIEPIARDAGERLQRALARA